MDETSPAPGSAPLNGWKEIASYLGRSVRAVQRWEHELGLPVHRIRTHDGQTVYAFREEIDKWRQTLDASKADSVANSEKTVSRNGDSPPHDLPTHVDDQPANGSGDTRVRMARRPIAWFLGTTAVLAALVLFLLAGTPLGRSGNEPAAGPAVRVHWEDNVVHGVDASDRIVWSHPFVNPNGRAVVEAIAITDFDADGLKEFIVGVKFAPLRTEAPTNDAVYFFTNRGQVQRKVTPATALTCGGKAFDGPWQVKAIAVEDVDRPRRTWIAWVHHTWYPSFVMEVDPDGVPSLRYVQAGWVIGLRHWRTPAGPLLAAAGVLNEYGRASVAFVQVDGPAGGIPSAEPGFQCGGSANGMLRVNLFPKLETTPGAYDFMQDLRPVGADLKVSEAGRAAIVTVGPDLRVKDYGIADNYAVMHRQAEMGKSLIHLDHPVEQCPFPNADKEILAWTPPNGWERHTIRPMPWVAPKTPK